MICVDSSVVVKWLVPETFSDQALALRRSAAERAELMVAPVLLAMEINYVLLKKTHWSEPKDYIDGPTAFTLLDNFLGSEVQLFDPAALHRNAFRIALSYQLPAVYDAYYLALAADAQCPFWTADKRLINGLNGRLPFVHWLGDFRD